MRTYPLGLMWCVALFGLTAHALPPNFTSGPTVVSIAGRQVQVAWRTSVDATSEVAWGPASTTSFDLYPNRNSPTAVPGLLHTRTLRHLAPGVWFLRVRSTNGPDRLDSTELTVTVPADEQWPRADVALDGTVNTIVTSSPGLVHLGGSFTRAYSNVTGSGVLLDRTTGVPTNEHFPEIAGVVWAASRDVNNRRLYVCGSFGYVGGDAHAGLARLLVDGNVDPTFTAQVNGPVRDCAVEGTTLYFVGSFSSVNGQPRGNAAALDLTNDTLLPWNPRLNAQGTRVVAGMGRVFVAGDFTQVGTTPRARVAGVDPLSGVANGFVADTNGTVRTLLLNDQLLFLGGLFDTVNGVRRPRLAQVDVTSGAVTAFDAQVVGTEVTALATGVGHPLYLGGRLTSVRGMAFSWLAAVNPTTGVLSADALAAPNNAVTALTLEGTTLCVGGTFSFLASSTRRGAGCFDTGTGMLTGFHPDLSGPAQTIVPIEAGGALFVGGSFAALKPGTAMSRYLRLDTRDGGATAGPAFSGTVFALALGRDTLYAGGFFTTAGGLPRSNLAAIDVGMNALTPWDPSADQSVHALEVSGSTIYVGGDFSNLGGRAQAWAGAVSLDGGALPFAPQLNDSVEALTVAHGSVYLGGTFTTVNGSARSRLVAVDPLTGATEGAFTPTANGTVYALSATPQFLYVGGSFSTIGGVSRGNGAAFKPESAVQSWDPRTNGTVRAVRPLVGGAYLGGDFTSPFRAAVETDNDGGVTVDAFRISEPGVVRVIGLDCGPAQVMLVGGNFFNIGPAPAQGIAVLDGRSVCPRVIDAGVDAGMPDAGATDAGRVDAGALDAGEVDAGSADAGVDAGDVDAGDIDAGDIDAGDIDAGPPVDAGAVLDDAGVDADGGRDRYVLPVGCGCSSGVEALALLRRRLRRAR